MGGNPVSNASQIDSVLMNENGASVATETQVGTANSALVKTALNATGTAPIYACRAWVNFNGTGTVAIRASGNVSSITDNEVGLYTVNFTTAMPDVNYSTSVAIPILGNIAVSFGRNNYSQLINSVLLGHIVNQISQIIDMEFINVQIFR